MNQRDKLKEQKKRLQDYLGLDQDVMYAGDLLEGDSRFTTFTIQKVSPIIATLKIPQNTKWSYYHLL